MSLRTGKRHGGFTLLECLIYCALMSLLAVGTMRAIGDARMIRSNARDRTPLAIIAQSELERLRSEPPGARKAGTEKLTKPEWPRGTRVEVQTTELTSGTWTVEVRAARESIEGKPTVRLASVVGGAR